MTVLGVQVADVREDVSAALVLAGSDIRVSGA